MGDGEIETIRVLRKPNHPPAYLDFRENFDETMRFFTGLRRRLRVAKLHTGFENRVWVGRTPSGRGWIRTYSDFSKIEEISTSAALVLTAEYARVIEFSGNIPPILNIDKWKSAFFRTLFEIGFFGMIGHQPDAMQLVKRGSRHTLRIVSGKDNAEIKAISNSIENLVNSRLARIVGEERSLALSNAISEAINNVARHAYPEDHEFDVHHVGKWWITATVDTNTCDLVVSIYDQGATIPVTYPKQSLPGQATNFLRSVFDSNAWFDNFKDSAYIQAAVEYGATQTGEANRGLGLPEMKEAVDIFGGGSLTIISRGGLYRYEHGTDIYTQSCSDSIGGTLAEWHVRA